MEPNPYESPTSPPGRPEKSPARTIILLLLAPFASMATAIVSYYTAVAVRIFADEVFNGAGDMFLIMIVWPMIVLPPVAVLWAMLRWAFLGDKRATENRHRSRKVIIVQNDELHI